MSANDEANADESPDRSTSSTAAEGNSGLLHEFREQWKAELTGAKDKQPAAAEHVPSKSHLSRTASSAATTTSHRRHHVHTDEEIAKATHLFYEGSRLEKRGEVFEAMLMYRKATQLVPHIEQHVYQSEKERMALEQLQQLHVTRPAESGRASNEADTNDDEDLSNVDLMARFAGAPIQRATTTTTTTTPPACHLGDMPAEVLLYILRWVCTAQLDTRSLDQVALVARGLYPYARDDSIWRSACQRVWGAEAAAAARPAFRSWRHLYTTQSRIQLHGLYASRTSYFRYGEHSFQDSASYRPMHMIEYYRYVRFFADGHVYMLTTPEAPASIVPRLAAQRQPQRPDLLCGEYTMGEQGTVSLRLRRQRVVTAAAAGSGGPFRRRRRESNVASSASSTNDTDLNTTYHIEFRTRPPRTRRTPATEEQQQQQSDEQSTKDVQSALIWQRYAQYRDSKLLAEFELSASLYPRLQFRRVKEFHSVAAEPLT